MKKKCYILLSMIVCLILLLCTACQPAELPKPSDAETNETEQMSKAPTTEPTVGETESYTETESNSAAYEYYIDELESRIKKLEEA